MCLVSYVGWITNFIHQRNHAAASCAFSYSRLSFLRGMPCDLRVKLQNRLGLDGGPFVRGFVMPISDFLRHQHGKRGQGQITVTPTWRNSKALKGRDRHIFLQFLDQQFAIASVRSAYNGQLQLDTDNSLLTCALNSGVFINGYSSPWAVGTACAYIHDGADKIGLVRNMFYRRELSRDLVAFQIAPHSIVENLVLGRKIMFSVSCLPSGGDPDLVLWKDVQYKCLLIPNGAVSTVLVVNSTKTEESTYDYQEV